MSVAALGLVECTAVYFSGALVFHLGLDAWPENSSSLLNMRLEILDCVIESVNISFAY